jgi:SAM-dependent methyltransferase
MTGTEWASFFNGHAPGYEGNVFTKNTVVEVDFAIEELRLAPGAAVLDVGCGTGRHAIELARRGYAVTGIDVSAGMLAQARARARAARVEVDWREADAARFTPERQYDGVICLCEGAFGLLGSRDDPVEQPLAILRNVAAALKPGGRCLFTVLNGLRMVRRHGRTDGQGAVFDPMTMTECGEHAPVVGGKRVPLRERGFVPTELRLFFEVAGLDILGMWGGTAGTWARKTLDPDEIEIMVLAHRAEPLEARSPLRLL